MISLRIKDSFLNRNAGYILLFPALLFISIVIVYPTLNAIWMSFFDVSLFRAERPFVGLQNYIDLFTVRNERVRTVIANTITFAILTICLSVPLALYIANKLNKPYPGRGFFRTIFLLPWVMPPIVTVTVWKFILNERLSPINGLLMELGLINRPIAFLSNLEWGAGPFNVPMFTLIVVSVWGVFPFLMVMFLAAMQSVPTELFEAATVDGANNRVKFFYIMLPSIKPVMIITTLLVGIWQFNSFNTSFLLTTGGPLDMTRLIAVDVYIEAFINFNFSRSSTIAVVTLLMVIIPAVIYVVKTNKEETT